MTRHSVPGTPSMPWSDFEFTEDSDGRLFLTHIRDETFRGEVLDMYSPYDIAINTVYLTDVGIIYLAEHPELPGCLVDGDSPEEAVAELSAAREVYLEDLDGRGLSAPPEKNDAIVVLWDLEK